jgi:sigma-B regulation protein RsbU (phosphoserine phosphatase)
VVLGVVPSSSYQTMEVTLESGDRLVLYTDGVTEAANPAEEEYGDVRLEAYVRDRRSESGRQLLDGIVADVLRFCHTARPHDDMTLMCLDRGSPAPGSPVRPER